MDDDERIRDQQILLEIAREIVDRWEDFALYLGLTEPDVSAIKHDNSNDYEQQKSSFLFLWKRRFADEATYPRLVEAAAALGRAQLANTIRRITGITLPPPTPQLPTPLCMPPTPLPQSPLPQLPTTLPQPSTSPVEIDRLESKNGSSEFKNGSAEAKNEVASSSPLKAIRTDTEELEDQFGVMTDRALDIINEKEVTVKLFKQRLISLNVRNKELHMEFLKANIFSESTVEDMCHKLGEYWNFLNYTLLEHLIKKFGDQDLLETMKEYKRKLAIFRGKTRLCDFVKLHEGIGKCNEVQIKYLSVKFDKNWETCTLKDMEDWKESLTQKLLLPSSTVNPTGIDPGCVSITWAIPAMFATSLVEKLKTLDMTGFCSEHRILFLTFDGVKYFGAPVIVEEPHTSPSTRLSEETVSDGAKRSKSPEIQDLGSGSSHAFGQAIKRTQYADVCELSETTDSSKSVSDESAARRRRRRSKVSGIPSSSDSGFQTYSDSGQATKREVSEKSAAKKRKGRGQTSSATKRMRVDQEYVQKYSEYLKKLYSSKERKTLAPFKLAGLEKKEGVHKFELNNFSRSTLRGDQDDVIYCKHHMDQDEIGHPTWLTDNKQPRLILIEGAPGVGKTTFSGEFCYGWSQGKLLSNHKLLVLLPLRDNRVKSARNVSDLFQHPQLKQEIAEQVESSGGEGVALWLEAWDELEENKRQKSSVFLDLVHGRVLPKATVIVTSRPWATENLKATSSGIDQHIEIVSTPTIQFSRILSEDKVRPDVRANLIDYVDKNPSIKAAMHTPVTADIVAEVFQWSQDTDSPLPRTTTKLYETLTCKLLSGKAEGQKPGRMGSLEEVAAERKGGLLKMCRLAWEGIIKQQLTFSSDVVAALGGDTLGLAHKVRELYGGEDGQFSYHFIHLTLQEFLSAYHLTQLPQDIQDQEIRKHIAIGHLNMVVRFYFGLTKPSKFTSAMISEQLSDDRRQATAYHWLFEAGDVVTEELESNKEVSVSSSYSWNPLDYYVVGHCISHYQFQWKLNFNNTSMGDEGMEMLSKGMASNTNTTQSGEIEGNFRKNQITSEGLKWFLDIPIQLLQQIKELDFGGDKLDGPALNTFCEAIPHLTNLQQLCLSSNPIGKGGIVETLKRLHHYKTPLKELDLAITDIGEEDCAQLPLLTHLEDLDVSGNRLSFISIASIVERQLQNSTIRKLHMSDSNISEENCMSLSSLLEQSVCQLSELNISLCGISGEGAVHLGTALTKNRSLKKLDIMENPIGDIGAAAFGDMLGDNTMLETLYMTRCEITSRGFVQLAAGLISNASLKTLWIGDNKCEVEGAKAIGDMMEKNKTLQVLALQRDESDASLMKEGIAVIMAGLQKNTTLHQLWLSEQYKCPADPRVEWM